MKSYQLLTLLAVCACDPGDQPPAARPPTGEAPTTEVADTADDAAIEALLASPDVALEAARMTDLAPPTKWLTAIEARLSDPDVSVYIKSRCVTALRRLEVPEAVRLLEHVVDDENAPALLRRTAIKAYAQKVPDDAIPRLVRLVDHPDRRLRDGVLHALAGIRTPAARAVLETRAKAEEDAMLRGVAQTYLEASQPR